MNELVSILYVLASALAVLQLWYMASAYAMTRSGKYSGVKVPIVTGILSVALIIVAILL